MLGRGYNSLGHTYLSLGDVEKAIEFYKLGLTIAKETGNKYSEGRGYIDFGKAYQSLHYSQKAIEFHQQGLSIVKKTGDKDTEQFAYGELARAFRSLGDFLKAEGFFKSKIKLVEEMRVLLQEKDEWKISFRNVHDFRGLVALQLQQCKIIESLFTAEAGRAQALADLMERQHGGKKSIPLSSKLQMELILSNMSSHISSPTLFLDRERDRYTCDEAVYIWLLLKGQCQFVRKEISVELKKLINQTYKQIGVKGRGRSDNPEGGGGVTQQSFIQGDFALRSHPLPFYIPFLTEKVFHSHTFYRQMVPLSKPIPLPGLEFCIPFNCRKCIAF